MKKLSKILLISLLAVLLAVGSASATAFLKLDDGVTIVEIQDESSLDTFVGIGVVAYAGPVGSWDVNVLSGISKDVLGNALEPNMDFASQNTGGVGSLTVSFSDTDFEGSGDVPFFNWLGGTTDGTVEAMSYYDLGNVAFGESVLLSYLGTFGPGAYSGSGIGSIDLGDGPSLYSLTMVAEITHSSSDDVTSFDNEMGKSVPEPATMLLLGSGFIGLVGFRRRFKN